MAKRRATQNQATPARLASASQWFEPQPQDLVVTLLGAFAHPSHRTTVWSGGLVRILGEFGFSMGAARVALARLVRRDLLSRVKEGRLVHYRLTPRCEQLLAEGDRRIFSLGRDEGRDEELWTVLWHTIPEDQRLERARLARRLRFLGFGSVQHGTWASPHDREEEVTELLVSLDVAEYAVALVGRPVALLDFRAFVTRAWDIQELEARYEAFAREFSPYLPADARASLSDREAFLMRTRLVHMFRAFPFLDPEIPEGYMSEPRHRAEAVSVFHALYEALATPAQRHFDEVTLMGGEPAGLAAAQAAAG
jgi:phenylacetic acid degradation operon negative regulatory protein